jgi:uncharacterized membrane protein
MAAIFPGVLDEEMTGPVRPGCAAPATRPATKGHRNGAEGPEHTSRRHLNRLSGMDLDFALVLFDGEGAAAKRFGAARDRSGADARWTREVGLVEHHHSGHLLLRGTFDGHYVDLDENNHVSEKGTGEGAVTGGLIGALLGPPGFAVGIALGGVIGSQVGTPSESDAEPQVLVDQLRALVPRSCSAIVLIAPAHDVDEMLAAAGDGARGATRKTLSAEQAAALEASLSATPPSSPAP